MPKRPKTDHVAGIETTDTLHDRSQQTLDRLTEPATEGPSTVNDFDLPLRFEARRMLGRGGMGVVIEVLDRNLGREVAVKILAADKRDPTHRVRFRREAKAVAVLRHPNIVTVHDVDPERDLIVMELIRGESLRARLKRDGKLDANETRRIGMALLDALAAAHDAKIIHRDVKPGNILFDENGIVKLVDFGIASFGDGDLTATGARVGTPAYMAPEQLRGRVADVRADLYAVGATLFEMTTGTMLHDRERTPDEVNAAVFDATRDAGLAAAITRAVAARPEDRFASARELAEALGSPPSSTAVGQLVLSSMRRRWWLVAAALAIAVAGSGVTIWALRDRGSHVIATSRGASTQLATVAILPFADRTAEPRLDFATSGLPHILATELRTIRDLRVIGYYELLDHVSSPTAPRAEWRAAAEKLGAQLIVTGELTARDDRIRLAIVVDSMTGVPAQRFERTMTLQDVPAVTRAMASDVARAAIGRSTISTSETRHFDIERNLQLGIAALEAQDFTTADDNLQKVELAAPNLAEAQYYRAVLNWWLSGDVEGPAMRALAGKLDAAQRGFMEGLRLVINDTHLTPAIDHFRALAEKFPDNRDIQYGLFEALYHGGFPAEAMTVYRGLAERHPRLRLGLKHALAYYIGHADEDGMRWVVARLDPKLDESALWQARALVARRDYAGAITLLNRHQTRDDGAARAQRDELVGIYLLDGQMGLASDLTLDWPNNLVHTASALLGLSTAQGRSADAQGWSKKARAAADVASSADARNRGWPELAAVELAEAHPERLQPLLKALPPKGMINQVIAYALVAGGLGDHVALERIQSSEFREAVAVADAFRAEWAKDWKRARAAWTRAVELAADGRFLIVEHLGLARAAKHLGDHAGVIAACDEVIRPRLFTWAWGGAVGPCVRWSAEAATALGREDDARASWKRLLALRANAPADDELVLAARGALSTLK